MAIFLVSYDLRSPGRNYQPLYDALGGVPHCHALESAWLIDVAQTRHEIRDVLQGAVDANDILLVTRVLQDGWASYNLPCAAWLQDPARRW